MTNREGYDIEANHAERMLDIALRTRNMNNPTPDTSNPSTPFPKYDEFQALFTEGTKNDSMFLHEIRTAIATKGIHDMPECEISAYLKKISPLSHSYGMTRKVVQGTGYDYLCLSKPPADIDES